MAESSHVVVQMKEVSQRVIQQFSGQRSFSKVVMEAIIGVCAEYERILFECMLENERLRGRLDEMKVSASASRIPVSRRSGTSVPAGPSSLDRPAAGASVPPPAVETGSWSQVVRGPRRKVGRAPAAPAISEARAVPAPKLVRPEQCVVIKPLTGTLTGKEVREKLVGVVGKSLQLKVEGIREIKSGGVLVRTANELEAAKLKESGLVKDAGLSAENMREPGKKLLVYDVEDSMTDEEFVNEIVGRNLENVEGNEVGEIKVISKKKFGRIIEVNDIVRTALLKVGRIYMGWNSLRVRDFAFVDRCYGCHAFGHMAKACPLKVPLCSICCEPGHKAVDCPTKRDVCRNCRRAGLESGHSVFSIECPSYKNKLNTALNRTRKW